jgi:hypothetical protein
LNAGIEILPVQACPIEITIDIKIEIVYVLYHRSVFGLGYNGLRTYPY